MRRRSPCTPALLLLLAAMPAFASPLELLGVGDPLEAELRVLELYDPPSAGGRVALPHIGSLPLQRLELMGVGSPAAREGARGLALWRIERALQRDATAAFAVDGPPRSTSRLVQRAWPEDLRLELSAALDGAYDAVRTDGDRDGRWRDGSGVHVRGSAQVDRWLAYTHLSIGELRGAHTYTDVLVSGTDVALQTEESYLSYTAGTAWSAGIGRSRWQWGHGEESSLLLSRTSAPLTALWLRARLAPLRADGFVLHATTDPGRGEQLAAHRLEWQPSDGLRLGLSEAARYRSSGWQGLYLAGVIPFSLVQRLQQQDSPGAADSVRNNVALSVDGAWRVADGTRLYGELLADDLHAKSANFPNKYAFQLGLDGAGEVRGTRLTWNAEYSWLSRYVYTSFFARSFSAQGRPLGFPTGPDARRLRVRISWDPRPTWQLTAIAVRTDKGENDLGEPFVPGSPLPDVATLEGTPEHSRTLDGTVRWWPASGVDVAATLGWERVDDAGHVAGRHRNAARASLAFRLAR